MLRGLIVIAITSLMPNESPTPAALEAACIELLEANEALQRAHVERVNAGVSYEETDADLPEWRERWSALVSREVEAKVRIFDLGRAVRERATKSEAAE